ncbi:MAG: alpha/beta hydrolase [Oscillospiraceae bacterium]|nr:alpha/beta hydrolase [Oscillospiraceae bacterium]
MPIIKLKDVELYYEEFGSGDRYLIQAQQFVNSYVYYTKDLAEKCGFHAYIIRIRGYAPSALVYEDLGDDWYDVWAQDVVDFADAMGIDKFFYTGHSHGAGIGWHLCMNHPDRLRGFFASGSGPHMKDGKATGAARMMTIEAAKSRETWVPYAEKQAAYVGKAFIPMQEDPTISEDAKKAYEQTVEFWTNMPPESALLNPRKPFPRVPTEETLAEVLGTIHVPTIMLGGTADTISGPELMVRTLRALKDSKLVLYHGVDHVDLPIKMKDEYVGDIMAFCNERGLI